MKTRAILLITAILIAFLFTTAQGATAPVSDAIFADDFAIINDDLLIRKDNNYFLRSVDGLTAELSNASALQPVIIDNLGFDWDTGIVYQPQIENKNELTWVIIAETDEELLTYMRDSHDLVFVNNALFLSIPNFEHMAIGIYQYSFNNHSLNQLNITGAHTIALYDEANILIACYDAENKKHKLYIRNATTNEQFLWGEMNNVLPEQMAGLTYDKMNKCAYFVLDSHVYRWHKDGEPVIIGNISSNTSVKNAAVTSNGEYWLQDSKRLMPYSLETYSPKRTLTIAGEYYSGDLNPQFADMYPEITVRNLKNEFYTMDQMLNDLTTRQATADILILNVSSGIYSAMVNKEFCVDMKMSGKLREFTQSLYQIFQEWTISGDSIYAIPIEIYPEVLISINESLMKELGISKPETYQQLLALYSDWDNINNDYSTQYALYGSGFATGRSWILNDFTNIYIASLAKDAPLDFEAPVYLSTLSYLDNIYMPPLPDNRNSDESETLLIHNYPLLPSDMDSFMARNGFAALPLKVAADYEAAIPTSLILMVVNAASSNQDIAIKYIECLVDNYPAQARIKFVDRTTEPIENESYADNLSVYCGTKNEIERMLEQAEPEDVQSLKTQLADVELAIIENETMRWFISSNDIQKYQSLIPYIRILPGIGYSYFSSLPNLQMLLYEYENGKIPAETFAKRLNSIQERIRMERE